jgi:sporulation protein YlmC with PRC-barrel domain
MENTLVYRLQPLIGLHIKASDGTIGKIKDVYFDDRSWAIRYLVVEPGAFFAVGRVLISPISVSSIDWDDSLVHVKLTMQQVKVSPPIDTDKPVSRQHEEPFFDYYGYPYYWTDPSLWLKANYPIDPAGSAPAARNMQGIHGAATLDPRLRSADEVAGYGIQTTTKTMGHVEDFLIDSATWAIRYLVVKTRNWLPAEHVVIPPSWINEVDWNQRMVHATVGADSARGAPDFSPGTDFSRAYEASLYTHYRRDPYGSSQHVTQSRNPL